MGIFYGILLGVVINVFLFFFELGACTAYELCTCSNYNGLTPVWDQIVWWQSWIVCAGIGFVIGLVEGIAEAHSDKVYNKQENFKIYITDLKDGEKRLQEKYDLDKRQQQMLDIILINNEIVNKRKQVFQEEQESEQKIVQIMRELYNEFVDLGLK